MVDDVDHGGHHGHGGEGGERGDEGDHSKSGDSGRLGSLSWLGPNGIVLTPLISLVLAIIGGIYWLIGLEKKIELLTHDTTTFRDNVLALNTPLSQRVFALEARVGENVRIITDLRSLIGSIDQNGTSQNKVLKHDLDEHHVLIAGQSARINELSQMVSAHATELAEVKIRLQFLIEAVAPHDTRIDRKK